MEKLILLLFVNKNEERSLNEISKIREVLDKKYKDQYELKILDILDNWEQAKSIGVIITPTLFKSHPFPIVKIALGGNLSQMDTLLDHLE